MPTNDGTAPEPYRDECHFEDCETRFLGISREEYVEHIREAHCERKANLYDTLVVEE